MKGRFLIEHGEVRVGTVEMQCRLARVRGVLPHPDGHCVCDGLAVSLFLQFYICFVTSTVRVVNAYRDSGKRADFWGHQGMPSTETLKVWAVTRGGWVCIWGIVVSVVSSYSSSPSSVRVYRAIPSCDLIQAHKCANR